MADILVTDVETGAEAFIPEGEFDASRHTLAEGQVATVSPTGAADEFAVGQAVTAESLRGGLLTEVSPEARAELTREQSEVDAGLGTKAAQLGRGALAGATFGLSEAALASSDPLMREQQRRERESASGYYLAGQIIGSVAPGLLTGGTGAAATMARLTPAGKLAAATGRLAAKGGLPRGMVGGAIEGAAGAAGDYVARVSLDDNPEFSGEALASAALTGALFGGGAAGVAGVAAKGAGRLAKAMRGDAGDLAGAGKLVDDLPTPPVVKTPDALPPPAPARLVPEFDAIAGGTKGKWTNYRRIVRRKVSDDNAEALRGLGSRIDDLAARGVGKEVAEIRSSVATLGTLDDAGRELVEGAAKLGDDVERAAERTQKAWRKYADEVELAKASKRVTKEASAEAEDELITAIAEADELATKYDRVMDEVGSRLGVQHAPIAGADEAAGQLAEGLGKVADDAAPPPPVPVPTTPGRLTRARELGETAMGGLEVAETAGLDVPAPSKLVREVPGVGGLLSLYLKYKGARAAAKKLGVLPATRATRAAGHVVSRADRVRSSVSSLGAKGLTRLSASKAVRETPARIAGLISNVLRTTPEEAAAQAIEATTGTTSAVQQAAAATAARAVEYLQATLPRDPMPARPASMAPWVPTTQEQFDANRRISAVSDPAGALDRLLTSPGGTIEMSALSNVYPARLAEMRAALQEQADELRGRLPFPQYREIGRKFGLPWTVESSVPGYGSIVPASPAPTPMPVFSRPSTPGASPSVNLESTEQQRAD